MIDHIYYAGLNNRRNWSTVNRYLYLQTTCRSQRSGLWTLS
ncbi:hypothetical protein AYI69_g8119, partial [Smittium culicis]